MNSSNSQPQTHQIVNINSSDRWEVYRRLQELQIPCQCHTYQPLQVEIDSATNAMQLWSVVRQVTASRHQLLNHLGNCWQMVTDIRD